MQEQFSISEGIDGSATNYTITYSVSDSTSERIILCDSVTISASACTSGQCNHIFDIPSEYLNLNSIMLIVITVFASNILGDGPSSEPFHLKLSKLSFHYALGVNNTILMSCNIVYR